MAENVNSQESGLFNMYYRKLNNYTLGTNYHSIEGIQVWILPQLQTKNAKKNYL